MTLIPRLRSLWSALLPPLAAAAGLAACSVPADRLTQVTPGVTVRTEIEAARGRPAREEPVSAAPGSSLAEYPESGERFQLRDDRVVARLREPARHERTLQYWRHRWKGRRQSREPLDSRVDVHSGAGFALRNEEENVAVFYREGGEVFRVVEY
jgi:hypothetical protein